MLRLVSENIKYSHLFTVMHYGDVRFIVGFIVGHMRWYKCYGFFGFRSYKSVQDHIRMFRIVRVITIHGITKKFSFKQRIHNDFLQF